MEINDIKRLERTEYIMLRWMYGGTFRNRKQTAKFRDCLEVVEETVIRGSMR